MVNRTDNQKAQARAKHLKSALRNNLKKRKGQARKLGQGAAGEDGFSVKLRARDIPKSGGKNSDPAKEDAQDKK